MDRSNIPDAAFAHVLDVNGVKYKIGRHHFEGKVRDGSEHDTVDPKLLAFALRTVDQIPVSEEEREKIRQHLMDHEAALAKDANRETTEGNEDKAKKIVNQQAGAPDGNETLTNPKADMKHEPEHSAVVNKDKGAVTAQLAQDSAGGSITGGGSTPTKKGEKDTDAGRPKGDHQDTKDVNLSDDPEKKTGKGTPAHGPKVSEGNDDTSRPGVETDGGETVETNPAVNDPATVPTSKSSEKAEAGPKSALKKGEKPMKDDKKAKSQDKMADKESEKVETRKKKVNSQKKTVDKPEGDSTYADVGDWVRNKDGIVGVVKSSEDGKVKIAIPRGKEGVSQEGWQVIVKASEVDPEDSTNLLHNEMRILNSPEALKLFATPTPEGQAARKNKICLCSADQLTKVGQEFIQEKIEDILAGKTVAKVLSVDKLGQRDLVVVRLGDANEEFPFSTAVEIERDQEGSPVFIRMLNDFLPANILKDFGKFLTDLGKESK